MIIGSIAFGHLGIQLLKYLVAPFSRIPSTWVNTKVISASASVTGRVDVAAKIASVGISTPPISQRSSESGSGMKVPRHVDDPDEDHERRHVREPPPDGLRRRPLLRDLHLGHLVDRLAERLAAVRVAPRP